MLEDVCIVDRIEEDTKNRVNTAAFACWVWMQNPNLLPRVSVFTLFPAGVGQVLETGGMPTPSQEVASAPLGRVRHLLIHLDMVEDWRPLPARSSNSSGSTDSDDPPRRRVHRFDWHLGYEDGVSPPLQPRGRLLYGTSRGAAAGREALTCVTFSRRVRSGRVRGAS